MLVTDGITYVMSDEEIAKIVGQCDDPNAAASRLVDQALLHASRDNCTALVLPLGAWNKVRKSTIFVFIFNENIIWLITSYTTSVFLQLFTE